MSVVMTMMKIWVKVDPTYYVEHVLLLYASTETAIRLFVARSSREQPVL